MSDEIKCPPCENEEFQCTTSKMCIGQPLICDGKNDCPDGSDEQQNCEGKQSFLTSSFYGCDLPNLEDITSCLNLSYPGF